MEYGGGLEEGEGEVLEYGGLERGLGGGGENNGVEERGMGRRRR